MRFDIITAVPALLAGWLDHSIVARARKRGLVEVHIHSLHDYSTLPNRRIDDYPFGGGGGMVLRPEPIAACLEGLYAARPYAATLYMSPDGELFTQGIANELAGLPAPAGHPPGTHPAVILLCGHYKGVDERIRARYVTREISVGDFVLTGGELPAALIVDAVTRLLPGVLGNEVSALTDSFQDGLLAAPVFTRPAVWEGLAVPEALMSGDHARLEAWRFAEQIARTRARRPDLLPDQDDTPTRPEGPAPPAPGPAHL